MVSSAENSHLLFRRRISLRSSQRTVPTVSRPLELCIAADCKKGIDPYDVGSVVRISMGYLYYRMRGNVWDLQFPFHDGAEYKYIHGVCADEIDWRRITTGMCYLCPKRPGQFFCEDVSQKNHVLPKDGCVQAELGEFVPGKRAAFVQFQTRQRGVVHWACAVIHWRGLKSELRGPR